MPGRSLYDVVGVDSAATGQEIRAAYRRAARGAHPDLGGSEAAFRRVNAAYEVLRDPARRAHYDRWLAAKAAGRPIRAPARPTATSPGAWGRPARPGPAAAGGDTSGKSTAGKSTAGGGRADRGMASHGAGRVGGREDGPDTSRLQRNYLVTMTTCLLLFVLSGAIVRVYSVPAAVAMAVVAMMLLPLAALIANRRGR